MCSVTLRSPNDSIGISLDSDTDFGHIITHVDPNSPADHAGIEQDDYIISVNHTPLINRSFEDALYFLKKYRKETKLDFLIAKRSYLLQSSQYHTSNERIRPSKLIEKNKSFTLPARQTSKELFQKYKHEQSERNQRRETITDEEYDRLSLQLHNNQYSAKHKKKHGKVLKGIGPATGLHFSWSFKREKATNYPAIPSDLYSRRPGYNPIK